MPAMIDDVRRRMGAPPRSLDAPEADFWPFLAARDECHPADYEWASHVYCLGRVAWGSFIMANSVLWQPGDENSFASVTYSFDPFVDRYPYWLARVTREISLLHDKDVPPPQPPHQRELYRHLRDEIVGDPWGVVPSELTSGRVVHAKSAFVLRSHLPTSHIVGGTVPIVVSPEASMLAAIVPWRYWPATLVESWRRTAQLDAAE